MPHAWETVSESTKAGFRHASGRGPARPWWASPLFRVEDEGDGRNDARVAHARPIVVENYGSWPCGQMLPRRRDRAGTRTWRSMGVTPPICPTCRSLEAVLAVVADSGLYSGVCL